MLRGLSVLLYFVKELIFDSSDEYNYKSNFFNIRKVLTFVLLSASFLTNIIFVVRIYGLAVNNIELKKENKFLCQKIKEKLPSDSGNCKFDAKPNKELPAKLS